MGRIINVQKLRWKNRKRKKDRKNGTREGEKFMKAMLRRRK